MKRYEYKGFKAAVRDGTSDAFVVREVVDGAYRKLNIVESDIVLDLGMNIGMFTVWARKKGATVYGFEPDPSNYQLAETNAAVNNVAGPNLFQYKKAVTGTNAQQRVFSLNVKKNKGAHSLVAKRGRDSITVACEHIDSIIARTSPTVIKMDIEGGEYECLRAVSDLSTVREFIMEFHHDHLNDIKTKAKYREVIGILEKHFPNVEYRPETKKAWVSIVYATRG